MFQQAVGHQTGHSSGMYEDRSKHADFDSRSYCESELDYDSKQSDRTSARSEDAHFSNRERRERDETRWKEREDEMFQYMTQMKAEHHRSMLANRLGYGFSESSESSR